MDDNMVLEIVIQVTLWGKFHMVNNVTKENALI